MKIAFFEIEPWEGEAFTELAPEHQVSYAAEPLRAANAAEHREAEVISTFIYSRLSREVLEQFRDLRLITTRSTGTDHIDLEFCHARGIHVANVPGYGAIPVAEHVFALLLGISHRLVEACNRTARGDFDQRGLSGFDLHGKTLGLLGTGEIGQATARIAAGFGMRILAYDIAPEPALERELGLRYVALDALLQEADVVSLHIPGTAQTENFLSRREFGLMKRGAVLINTARGNVVDVEALLHALADGRLAAAGLDVLPEEPVVREEAELLRSYFSRTHNLDTLLADHVLLRMRNVLVTPHTAFNTREAVQEILGTTRRNIDAFLQGSPQNLV